MTHQVPAHVQIGERPSLVPKFLGSRLAKIHTPGRHQLPRHGGIDILANGHQLHRRGRATTARGGLGHAFANFGNSVG
jgi:hypothetical protein